MTLQLVIPDKKYLPSVREAVAEYESAPSKFEILAVSNMIAATKKDFAEYFDALSNASQGINLKPGYVPNTVYWLIEDDQYIGSFDLRHSLTSALTEIGGHIAYQIRPSAQRKGYARKGLELCLEKAWGRNIEQALITCDEENIGSYAVMCKVMSENGGYEMPPLIKDGITEKRVWINTRKTNKRPDILQRKTA